MKIKAIKRDGNNAGEIVELSAEEKVPLTLQDALARHKEFEGKAAAWFTDIALTSVNFFPNGSLLKGKWQNNHYKAAGTIKLHLRKMDPDRLLAPKSKHFVIEFKDAVDSIGQPDTEVVKLTLE